MNLFSQFSAFYEVVAVDNRLKHYHISLYITILHFWNKNRYGEDIILHRETTLNYSKIGSSHTYYNSLRNLHDWGYIEYIPKKVGENVLPTTFSVYMDPSMKNFKGQDLNGYYPIDDQGVRGERVNVVENGILKNFLMTRTPLDGFPRSNGHARSSAGMDVTSRQSNLIVTTNDLKTDEQLRNLLKEEAKNQGKAYGYIFASVSGGFTMTMTSQPNAFNVTPVEVYRVFVDGRPDELVRGVDLVGTPLAMFSQIMCAGGKSEVFTGVCGAESGSVPVSAVSPSVLVKQVEMQRKDKSLDRLPILERPAISLTNNN